MACDYNKGDTITLLLEYTINETPLEEYEADEIEFCIGSDRFLLSDGDIEIDEATGKYAIHISQEQTFAMSPQSWYQIRIRKGAEVVSSAMQLLGVGGSISTEVI